MSVFPHEGPVLVAGIGNIFLGDDGFGVEAVRALKERDLPEGVELLDIGVRGVHLAYQLLDGYDTLILVDATRRGGSPARCMSSSTTSRRRTVRSPCRSTAIG